MISLNKCIAILILHATHCMFSVLYVGIQPCLMLRFNQPPLLKHRHTNTYRWTHQLRGCLCLELLSCEQCPAAPSSAQGSVRDTGESWWLKESETHILLHYVQTWMTAQGWPHLMSPLSAARLYCYTNELSQLSAARLVKMGKLLHDGT